MASEVYLALLSCLGSGLTVPTSLTMYETWVTHKSSAGLTSPSRESVEARPIGLCQVHVQEQILNISLM